MKIAAADVRPGKCFLSQGAKPHVVRVLSVHDGLVRFEARLRRRAWSGRGETAVSEFVAGLPKEVGSDYEPAADGRVHFQATVARRPAPGSSPSCGRASAPSADPRSHVRHSEPRVLARFGRTPQEQTER